MAVEPAAVQPAGEGGSGEQSLLEREGLYDVSSVPEELREAIGPIVKDIEGRITPRLQESAEQRKTLEAFQQLGISDPETAQQLVGFYLSMQDPEQSRQWWDAMGEEQGWFEDEGGNDDLDGELQGLTAEDVQAIVQQSIAPLVQANAFQQDQQALAQTRQEIDQAFAVLKETHGEVDEDLIAEIAAGPSYQQLTVSQAINKAFERVQQIAGNAEQGLIENKLGQTGGGLPGGRQPAAGHEPPKTFGDARKGALARLEADAAT